MCGRTVIRVTPDGHGVWDATAERDGAMPRVKQRVPTRVRSSASDVDPVDDGKGTARARKRQRREASAQRASEGRHGDGYIELTDATGKDDALVFSVPVRSRSDVESCRSPGDASVTGRIEVETLGRCGLDVARLRRAKWTRCKASADKRSLEVFVTDVAFDDCSRILLADEGLGTVHADLKRNCGALARAHAASSEKAESRGASGIGLDLNALFDAVKPNAETCPEFEVMNDVLLPTPRGYQKQACAWMMAREGAVNAPTGALDAKRGGAIDAEALHPIWHELPNGGGYINRHLGIVSKKRFCANFESVSGGILADEMGLGKTVEVIMLVLANPEPERLKRRNIEMKVAMESAKKHVQRAREPEVKKEELVEAKASLVVDLMETVPEDTSIVQCPCGAKDDDAYDGLWIACEKCETWMHARCVGLCSNPQQERHLMGLSPEALERKLHGFTCGKCIAAHASATVDVTCGATLVVCPSAIIEQWRDEIELHVRPGSLKVIMYEGQSSKCVAGGTMKGVFSAKELAEADIVFTTYDTLRAEIDIDTANGHGLEGAERARRYKRKYEVVPTPLTRLKWWRVVLDEAQMVESSVSKAAVMVRRLPAVHRWAVTGTPISRGLGDIFGLLTFLMVSPFEHGDFWWRRLIEIPYANGDPKARELLHSLLKGLMWRNSRADMEKQLGVPPQGEITTMLRSSAVEHHWYARQYSDCVNIAKTTLMRYGRHTDDEHIDPRQAATVMGPLLRLRQACDHPQAGSHGLAGGIRSGANVLTMDQISEKLIERARVETEEAQRLVAFTLNALAGLAWINKDFPTVIANYREVLKLEGDGQQINVRLDALQRLHALHNLSLAMNAVKANNELLRGKKIAPTMRDESLEKEAEAERQKYIAQRAAGIHIAASELELATNTVNKHLNKCGGTVDRPKWWGVVIDELIKPPSESDLSRKEKGNAEGALGEDVTDVEDDDDEPDMPEGASNLLARVYQAFDGRWQEKQAPFTDVNGLRFTMLTDLQNIQATRMEVHQAINDLAKRTKQADEVEVRSIGMCEKCRKDTEFAVPGVQCMFCKYEPVLEKFESMIFGVRLRVQMNRNAGGAIDSDDDDVPEPDNYVPQVTRAGRVAGERQDDTNRGGASSVETVLRMILPQQSWWKDKFPDSTARTQCYEESKAHVGALEEMRKEFYKFSQLIMRQREEMAARDELDMCVRRIRTREEHELPYLEAALETDGNSRPRRQVDPIPEGLRASIIFPHDVSPLSVNFTQQKAVCEVDLRKFSSQLKYLKTTLLNENGNDEAKDKRMECPICIQSFRDATAEVCVFPCGHRTCVQCALDLVRRRESERVSCVTCRERSYIEELMYVNNASNRSGISGKDDYARRAKRGDIGFLTDLLGTNDEMFCSERSCSVSGSWGTKIEAIVRRVRFILDTDERTKLIIFSEWDDVLKVVEKAIAANQVRAMRAESGPKFRAAVDRFKHDETVSVLLLPMKRGAQGLNLTEAQHVLLLEPVLDPGMEAQAIKRVDRIGQTRPTCVHRFVIRDTVEENVQKFSTERSNAMCDVSSDLSMHKKGKEDGLTLGEIRALLLRPTEFDDAMTQTRAAAKGDAQDPIHVD